MTTIIIIVLALIMAGGVAYYFLIKEAEEPVEEVPEWQSGVFYDPIIDMDVPLYSGSQFVLDYSRPPLLARYYIVPAKEGEVARFYKHELENFEVIQNQFIAQTLHFKMSDPEMMKYGEEDRSSAEAEEDFKDGALMTVEVGRAPFPFWNYSPFNTRAGGQEETMVIFWYFHPKKIQ